MRLSAPKSVSSTDRSKSAKRVIPIRGPLLDVVVDVRVAPDREFGWQAILQFSSGFVHDAARELLFLRERPVGFCRPILRRLLESFDPELLVKRRLLPTSSQSPKDCARMTVVTFFWITANT